MNIAIIALLLAALGAAVFGLVFLLDSIRPIAQHPDVNKIQWPIKNENTCRTANSRRTRDR